MFFKYFSNVMLERKKMGPLWDFDLSLVMLIMQSRYPEGWKQIQPLV